MFSCEFCEISKNTFFTEHLLATASLDDVMGKKVKVSIPGHTQIEGEHTWAYPKLCQIVTRLHL